MAYNTGLYVSYSKVLTELVNAGKLTSKSLVLSAKALVSGTEYSFTFSPATPAPVVGEFLVQGDFAALITNVTGTVLKADNAAGIVNGKAKAIEFDGNLSDLDVYIKQAMAFVDRHTRQWFNARTFDDTKPIMLEGNNTETLFLPVPILEITTLQKQKDSEILAVDDYQVFNGRSFPDDRRNPMIKLRRSNTDDVMFVGSGRFMRGVRAKITGIFGYLEEDGSTPLMIQRATAKLTLIYILKTLGESAQASADSAGQGPIKREKTDLHEIEYFDARSTGKDSTTSGSGLSGDDEVDDTIAAFKGPIIIGGSFPDIGVESPILNSFDSGRG